MLGGVWTGWNSPAWAIQHAPINWGHVSWANQTFTRPERGWQKIERILERQKENVRRGAALTEATMRGFHYCPALLLLWAVCSVSDVQADVRTVKLCGREFIRAVVSTLWRLQVEEVQAVRRIWRWVCYTRDSCWLWKHHNVSCMLVSVYEIVFFYPFKMYYSKPLSI